jgi:hypothetical protein
VRHRRRRADISGVGIRHVAGRAVHGAVLVMRRCVVVGTGVRVRHVVRRIHWLACMLLVVTMMSMLAMMVGVGRRVVMGPAAAARRRTTSGRGAHVVTALHLLPSRQMPPIVHHAGVGVRGEYGCCGSCSLDVRATAAKSRGSEIQQKPGSERATRRGVDGWASG